MIGGSGLRRTLPLVARYADMWNAFGTPDELRARSEVLDERCAASGRDPTTIERTVGCKLVLRGSVREARRTLEAMRVHNRTPRERVDDPSFWIGTPEGIAQLMIAHRANGFDTFIAELPAPFDEETIESFVGVVKPMVEAG